MSAEGKKKRGESGKKNAEHIPFRYGGSRCDYSTYLGRSNHPSGSTLVRGMVGGDLAAKLGYPAVISHRLMEMTEKSLAQLEKENVHEPGTR